jgi:hypothetical protein
MTISSAHALAPAEHATIGASERAAFARDGFVLMKGFFDPRTTAQIAAWTEQLAAAPETPGRHWVYREASLVDPEARVLQRIENFCPFHAGFRRLMTEGPLVTAVAALLGEAPVLFKDKINFKMPGGHGFKAHQDQQAGWSRYADYFVTALVSVDPGTEANGCLKLAPARHREGLLGPEWQPLADDRPPLAEYVSLPTEPGDVVFFDSFAPHLSEANLTGAARRALYVTWNRMSAGDQRERYYADKRASFPPDVERAPGARYVFRV